MQASKQGANKASLQKQYYQQRKQAQVAATSNMHWSYSTSHRTSKARGAGAGSNAAGKETCRDLQCTAEQRVRLAALTLQQHVNCGCGSNTSPPQTRLQPKPQPHKPAPTPLVRRLKQMPLDKPHQAQQADLSIHPTTQPQTAGQQDLCRVDC
jgi:hypothetical protein